MKATTAIAAAGTPICWTRLTPRSMEMSATLQWTLTEIPDTRPRWSEPDFMWHVLSDGVVASQGTTDIGGRVFRYLPWS